MPDTTNGNVKQGDFFREVQAINEKITDIKVMLERYHGLAQSASIERGNLKEALAGLAKWREETDKRIDELESKDKRVIALFGMIGVVLGAIITVIGNLLIAAS